MPATIFVKNLCLIGTHGAHLPAAKPKEFTLDIEIDVADIAEAVSTDDIAHAVDYRRTVAIARQVVEGSSVHLIETLASRIIKEIAADRRVQKIKLTLSKREWGDKFDSGITAEYLA